MAVIHNLRSIILYHEKRIRPQTLQAIKDAINSGDNAAMIPVDPSELDSFTQLIFFEPVVDDLLQTRLGLPVNERIKGKRGPGRPRKDAEA